MATAAATKKTVDKIPIHKHDSRLRQIKEHFAKLLKVSTSLMQVHALYNSHDSRLSRYRVNQLELTSDTHFSAGYKTLQSYFVVIKDPPYSGSDEDTLRRMKNESVVVVSTDPKLS